MSPESENTPRPTFKQAFESLDRKGKDALMRVYGVDIAVAMMVAIPGYIKFLNGMFSSGHDDAVQGFLYLLGANVVLEVGQLHARAKGLVPPNTETQAGEILRKMRNIRKRK